jgi:tetratricopeptide (TPR) repeat protein/class 3 adenylate cyclase
MAEVFLAREPLAQGLAKILVIKKIHPSLAETPQFRQMFEDEAKVAVNLNHPNIVQTFSYGQTGPTYYLAMEHVEGVDLLRLLNAAVDAKERIPFGLCAYLGQQVAKALDYAHRKTDEYGEALGIVHRDVSPQNVLVSWDGMVKLVDFGIARARHVKEEEGIVKGKFAYMSPEQAQGQPVDPRADIFSTGIVLWELTCARALFGNLKGRQALNAIKNAQVPRPREVDPNVPEELENIILKCLSRRPEDRFQTARDLHRALGEFFFALSSKEGRIYDSSMMAAFVAKIIPDAERDASTAPMPDATTHARSRTQTPLAPSGQVAYEETRARPTLAKTGNERSKDQLLQPAERKPVILVEGELSGLAALRRNMGEVRAREALLDFLRVTEHVAYKHQAHPDRLDDRGFTYVIGLPVGTEDDAARAVELAIALIDALDGISRELSPPLKLALGLSRGTALVSRSPEGQGPRFSYELLGQTAQVARRLATEAMPGEVLVGGGVFRGARGDWSFEELDAITLPPDSDTSPGSASARRQAELQVVEPGTTPGRAKVYRLLGPRPRAERLADHAGLRRLIGRDLELSALMDAHRAVVEQSRARYVLVLGDAGVGKAAIVDSFRHKLDPTTHLVLRAVGRPGLRDTPYALVADLTRDLFGLAEDAEPREIKRRVEASVALLFTQPPTPAGSAGGGERGDHADREARQVSESMGMLLGVKVAGADELDASERRHRLYAALRKLQTRLAEGRTLVVVIEDMHWADSQSYEILVGLVRDPIDRPVLGIATARHGDRIDALARSDRVTSILVGELGAREREELVLSRFADPADARALGREILERAGGNPFFIHEIIESLVERGTLQPSPNDPAGRLRWVRRDEAILVPTTVEAVLASRLDRLPDDERDTIRRGALLGRVFRVEDLCALLADAAPERVTRALVRLASRGIIAPASAASDVFARGPGAYAFRNTVTKQVAYDGLPADTKALLHSVAADRLQKSPGYRRGADDARLAEHLLQAGDRAAAGRALVSAGLFARDHASNTDAFTLLTRALELLPADAHDERYRVHGEREQILRGWGKRPAQLREVHNMRKHAAATAGTEGRRREAEAFARLGLLYLDVGKHAAARRELDRALALAREAADALAESEALRLLATLLMNIGKNAEALELAQSALAVITALGPPAVPAPDPAARADDSSRPVRLPGRDQLLARAQALNAVGNVHVHTGHLRDAVSSYAEALVIYRRLGARRLEAATLNNMGWVFVGLGEHEEALVHYKRSLRLAQELGDRAGIGVKLANIGQTYAELGDFARARRYLEKAIEIHTALSDQPGLADALISLAQVSLREGKSSEADQQLERGLELASETRNRYQEIRALVYLAFCRLDRGDAPEGALELAQSATRLAREAEIANGEVYGLCAEALALMRAGRPQEALSRSTQAVALFDSGRDVDTPEEVLYIHARAAKAASATTVAREALKRAHGEVQRKARRLRDESWRTRYLQAPPAREIVAEAHRAGIDDADLSA